MKKLVAFLLTLTLLLGMVGTVSVAAAEAVAEIPEFTATVSKDGTVTVKVDDGVKDYTTHYARVITKDGESIVPVELEYDSSKKAYVGQDEEAAGGKMSSFSLSKNPYKEDSKGTTRTYKSVSLSVNYSEGDLSSATYLTRDYTEERVKREDDYYYWVTTDLNEDYNYNKYTTKTGKLSQDTHRTSELTGDEEEQTSTTKSETRNYEQYQGVYTGKSITESELKNVYHENEGWVTESDKSTTKKYNKDDVLIGTNESEGKTTYNKKEDEKTYEKNTKDKTFSSKGYLKETEKTTKNRYSELDDDEEYFETKKYHFDNTTTNRDGNLKYTKDTTTEYGKEYAYSSKTTEKNYNTYTGAVTSMTVTETEQYKNKKTDHWDSEITTTETYNNDDGSLRRKTVTETYFGEDETTIKETHYTNENKVAAKKVTERTAEDETVTYVDDDGEEYTDRVWTETITWTDGNGKVIAEESVDKKTGDKSEILSRPGFKQRTGELDSWAIRETTTDKNGTKTVTTTYYDEAKKSSVEEKITKKDGSWKYYEDGVLRKSYDPEDSEYKYYDIKGTLKSYDKWDKDENARMYYNYDDKLTEKYERDEDNNRIYTYYDTATGKVKSSEKHYTDEEGADVIEYRNAKDKVLYSVKEFTDEDTGADVIGYYDEKDKEFARVIEPYYDEDGVRIRQDIYDDSTWDPENATGSIEKTETEWESDYRKDTKTTDYSKWTVTDGKKGKTINRTDKQITTTDDNGYETDNYVGGTLTSSERVDYNDYDEVKKSTYKTYDWYDGKMTGMSKNIYPDGEDNPNRYYKRYDRYSNLQEYSWTDDTDNWDWSYSYYADGTFKGEYWHDNLDYDSHYDSSYYLDGSLASENKWTGEGDERNGREVEYNRDGSYRSWADTVNGVTNEWVYNYDGVLLGYKWNQKSENNEESYDWYDAAGTLVYSNTRYNENLADGTYVTRTDPSGNKWAKKWNGEDYEIELTLKNKGNGWQNAVGEWFYLEKGEPVKEEWRQIDGEWYFFNADGMMATGLIPVQDEKDADKFTTYAANYDGSLGNGWTLLDDGYGGWAYTNTNGEVLTGWQKIDGKWYYFTDGWSLNTDETKYKEDVEWQQSGNRGSMVTGAARIWNSSWTDKHTYFFNEDGTWDNSPGWKVADNFRDIEYHYYNRNGVEVTGWNLIDGQWYYFNEDGVMKNGWVKSGNNWYFMDPQQGGAMATNGWAEDVYEGWYYMDKNGQYKTGWLNDGGVWYYLKDDGAMAENEWAKSGSNWYYMGAAGALETGWVQDHGSWYHLDGNGAMESSKWMGSGNTWYYLGADGAMAADTDVTIGGKTYHFDETGLCTNP